MSLTANAEAKMLQNVTKCYKSLLTSQNAGKYDNPGAFTF